MKILLTGYEGFIGTQIYNMLKSKGYEIDGVEQGDNTPETKYDIILHFGARTLIRNSITAPYEYFTDGLALTLNYLEKARKDGSMFVFPTSGSVEEATNPYSLSKKNGVEWIKLYEKLYGTRTIILKLYNIYGETSRKGAVYLFTKAALEGISIPVYGGGNQVRDFVHVNDLINCIYRILSGEVKPGEYEIGTGIGTSINALIIKIEQITGRKVLREEKDFLLKEAQSLYAKNPLPINPVSVEEGIKRVVIALENERKGQHE
ncbi:MAG: NAD-dependent epimerase/dehydratase family protein [Thermoplasmataceae archaeon]